MSATGFGRGVRYLVVAATVIDVVAFTYLGHLLFEAPAFGGAVGLLTGAGTYLFLPGTLAMDANGAADTAVAGMFGPHRTAAGWALAAAGIVALGAAFAVDGDFPLALLVGALVGAVGYLPLAWQLPGE